MIPNQQYDYDYGPNGPLAALQARSAHPNYSAMIAPPVGWVPLVVELDEELAAILPDYIIAQVKEKFGRLCYYINTYGVDRNDPRVDLARALIDEAENRSKTICQICGEPGTLRTDAAWYAVFCDIHADTKRNP